MDAWFTTVKSFDTVDRSILHRVLSSLGLPAWFRHVYFQCHAKVRLRFKLAAGLGEPWTGDGGFPQGCPLSMMFIVALYLPWWSCLTFLLSCMLIISSVSALGQALHGVEASHLSQSNLLKLRAAFVRACWSSRLTLAHIGTVLGMLDGPECVDRSACIVWYRFRLLRRYLAYRPLESARVGRLLDLVSDGAPGQGPVYLLVDSAASLGFQWCLGGFCWNRPGLPRLPMVEGPYQHFEDSILNAWRDFNSANLCRRKGFRGGPLLDFRRSMQLLDSSHARDRNKALLRAILSGGFGTVFS